MIREDRYIVLKRKDIEKALEDGRIDYFDLDALSWIKEELPSRKYVVVESDWPEYEQVWKMIEERVENTTA